MTISVAEFRRFKKIMERTTSPVDAEALASIRAANAIVAASGSTWTQILDRVVKVQLPVPEEARTAEEDRDHVEALFDVALNSRNSASFQETLEDIYERWQAGARLTEAQRNLVERAAEYARGLR